MTCPALAANDVHLWTIRLDDPGWDRDIGVLDAQERLRAGGYLAPLHRQRFARGHAALRLRLAAYLGCAPAAIAFDVGAHGKPRVANAALHFSFSHSHEMALLAVAWHETGVDVEYTARPLADLGAMIDLVCHAAEKAVLARLAPDARQQAFYRLWTQKEAYVKARGIGLARRLDTLCLAAAGEGAWHVREQAHADASADASAGTPADAGLFTVRCWDHAPSYVASLCAPPGIDLAVQPYCDLTKESG